MPPYRNEGFSLLEVLLSVLVLSVGLLGVLALQLMTLRAAQQAHVETAALHLATDIAERLRGATPSREAMRIFERFDFSVSAVPTASDSSACFGIHASCTPVELAHFDMAQWMARIEAQLPGGHVRTCRDRHPWQTATKQASWECSGEADAPMWIKIGWQDRTSGAHTETAPRLMLPAGVSHD